METYTSTISDKRKNACAIHLMRNMLIKYLDKHNVSFEDAMLDFTKSNTYEALFDYSDAIWKEGPDYLLDLYEEELNDYK